MYSDHGLPSLISSQILPPSSSIQVLTSPPHLLINLGCSFVFLECLNQTPTFSGILGMGEKKGEHGNKRLLSTLPGKRVVGGSVFFVCLV